MAAFAVTATDGAARAGVLKTLHGAIVTTITEPGYVERQAQGGSEITPTSPEEMRRIQIAEIQLYRDMMKIAGIEPE